MEMAWRASGPSLYWTAGRRPRVRPPNQARSQQSPGVDGCIHHRRALGLLLRGAALAAAGAAVRPRHQQLGAAGGQHLHGVT